MRGLPLLINSLLAASIPLLGCSVDSGDGTQSSAIRHKDKDCDDSDDPCDPYSDAGCPDDPCDDSDAGCPDTCTLTQGYWKNHEEDWPVAELSLGSTTYPQADLLDILRTPVAGNGLISLAHQLIAAKLNLANGADAGDLGTTIDDVDALIGDLVVPDVGDGYLHPRDTSAWNGTLGDFNEGATGPGHCDD